MEETREDTETERVGRDSFARNAGFATIALAVLCVLTYGVTLNSLGFYWDDWPGMTVTSSLGWHGIQDYVGSDRPATAWLFAVTAPLGPVVDETNCAPNRTVISASRPFISAWTMRTSVKPTKA